MWGVEKLRQFAKYWFALSDHAKKYVIYLWNFLLKTLVYGVTET